MGDSIYWDPSDIVSDCLDSQGNLNLLFSLGLGIPLLSTTIQRYVISAPSDMLERHPNNLGEVTCHGIYSFL